MFEDARGDAEWPVCRASAAQAVDLLQVVARLSGRIVVAM